MLPRFPKYPAPPVAEPDVNPVRRDVLDSVFLNGCDEFYLAQEKSAAMWFQDKFLQTPLSSGHLHLQESHCSLSCEIWRLALKTTVTCLPYFETFQKDPFVPEKLLFSLSMFCWGGSLCLECRAPISFKPLLKPHCLPTQGKEPSLPSSLSTPIICLYSTFPVAIYSCHHGYWWWPQESLASNPCPLKASGWNGSRWGAFSGLPPSHVHSMPCPWFCFAFLSLPTCYLTLICLFLHDTSNSFWTKLGVNVIIWTILACASPPHPCRSPLTVLALTTSCASRGNKVISEASYCLLLSFLTLAFLFLFWLKDCV